MSYSGQRQSRTPRQGQNRRGQDYQSYLLPGAKGITPQSLEAEQSTLGAMLMERGAIETARSLLEARDLNRELHRHIFSVIVSLHDSGSPVDLITVVEELRTRGLYEDVGGAAYLEACIKACPSSADVETYAKTIVEKSIARDMLREVEIVTTCLTTPRDVDAYGNELPGQTDFLTPLQHLETRLHELRDRRHAIKSKVEYSDDTVLDSMFDDISWLWPGWIPRGSLTLLAGRPGTGKSTVAMDICKRIILDMEWPDGQEIEIEDPFETEEERPTKLLWLDTESGLGIFRQRLVEWEFPRGHFVFPKDRETAALRVDDDRDWAWIKQAVAELRPPLVVVDSLAASHSGDENSNDSMKVVMLRLADLAAEFNIAVICIHHLNKLPAGFPDWPLTQDMVRGASVIVQYPRSIIGVGTPNKDEPLSHGFMSIKMNAGCPNGAIGYTTTDFGPAWGEVAEVATRQKPIEHACNWLRNQLANGPRLSSDLYDMAREEQICSKRTLETASKNIGVRAMKEPGAGGRWFWELKNTTP